MVKIGEIYRKLVDDDFKILEFFVHRIKKYEYIPLQTLIEYFNKDYTQKEIMARIKKLVMLKLIEKHSSSDSYRLRFLGLDCYALKKLASKNILKAIGDKIGVGKESDVYRGIAGDDSNVVVKFYRIGRRSFRNIARVRDYGSEAEGSRWILRSILAGNRERAALEALNRFNINGIPKLYGGIYHTVVIEYIEGPLLIEVKSLENPKDCFNEIIDTIKKVFQYGNIVHGDLSPYNIMIDYSKNVEKPIIIDWPQYVPSVNPLAIELLKKDLHNIIKFFNKRFNLNADLDQTLKYVLEKS